MKGKKEDRLVNVAGSSINLDSADLKKVKNAKGLSKLKIFSHLEDEEDRAEAEAELAGHLGLQEETHEEETSDEPEGDLSA